MINILLIGNKDLKQYFSNDFNVLVPELKDNFYIKDICKENKIDVIFQVENLDKREIIYDLPEINCLKIFWAIDIHLNFYWQKDYFKNFDIVFTTQLNFVSKCKFEKYKIFWLPWGIYDHFLCKEFVPFSKRNFKITFVGLIDENRIKRKNIIRLVKENFDVYIAGDSLDNRISFGKMIEIYRNSCIVLNESILYDVNFRYFEVTSQGALLFTEKISNGENILFLEKDEFIRYSQLNIIQKLNYFSRNIDLAEKIAFKGYLKTKKFHKLSDRIKIVEKIINKYKNFRNNDKRELKYLTLPMVKTYLRGIGKPFYKRKFIEINNDKYLSILFLKLINNEEFLKQAYNFSDNLLIYMNWISEVLNDYNEKEIFKIIKKLLKDIPEYYQGYINIFSKSKLFFTVFEFINFIYNKFQPETIKSKKINHLSASILMKYKNFQGAIIYLLNLQREYPENTLFRKMLAKCYWEIYEIDLWTREILKVFLLERKFEDFKKFNVNKSVKKEVIFEIISHIKDKKLIRDILFNFE